MGGEGGWRAGGVSGWDGGGEGGCAGCQRGVGKFECLRVDPGVWANCFVTVGFEGGVELQVTVEMGVNRWGGFNVMRMETR